MLPDPRPPSSVKVPLSWHPFERLFGTVQIDDAGACDEVLTVRETSTSPAFATDATRAPMCTAMPVILSSISSHSPV